MSTVIMMWVDEKHQDFCESPTLVTVDDGKAGIKHIKVARGVRVLLQQLAQWQEEVRQVEDGMGLGEMVRWCTASQQETEKGSCQ